MTFAVIKTGGKQYKVKAGDTLLVEKLDRPEKGDAIVFEEVLLVDNGETTKIGKDVKGAKVTATIVSEGKAKKIHVIKFKAKSNRKQKIGHRQPFTRVKIEGIK